MKRKKLDKHLRRFRKALLRDIDDRIRQAQTPTTEKRPANWMDKVDWAQERREGIMMSPSCDL